MEGRDEEFVASYLAALERADLDGMLKLFTPDAVVHSPQYRQLPAAQFYPALLADTGQSRLTLKGILKGRRLVEQAAETPIRPRLVRKVAGASSAVPCSALREQMLPACITT